MAKRRNGETAKRRRGEKAKRGKAKKGKRERTVFLKVSAFVLRFAISPFPPRPLIVQRLSRYSTTSLVGTTSPYLEPISKRLASCGSWARSPTASSGTIGRNPCASASITVARTQPLVVQPVTTSVSTAFIVSVDAR